MKQKIFTLVFAVFGISALAFFTTCSKNSSPETKPSVANNNRKDLPTVKKTPCPCGTKPSCGGSLDCLDNLMGNSNKKGYTITWESCVNPDPSNTYCNGFDISGNTSNLILCYNPGSCNTMLGILQNLPSCLPCVPDPYCFILGTNCPNSTDLYSSYYNPATGNTITINITGDPKITVTCGSGGNNSSCTAHL